MLLFVSFMYSRKRIGPRTEPSGTPDVTNVLSDRVPLTETLCFRCKRNDFINCLVFSVIPLKVIFDEAFMRDFVKSFGEIKQDGIYLCLKIVIYSCYPIMDCLDELGLTRQP